MEETQLVNAVNTFKNFYSILGSAAFLDQYPLDKDILRKKKIILSLKLVSSWLYISYYTTDDLNQEILP